MPTDGGLVPSADPEVSQQGRTRSRLRQVLGGLQPGEPTVRMLLHLGFLPAVLAGLMAGRACVYPGTRFSPLEYSQPAASLSSLRAAANTASLVHDPYAPNTAGLASAASTQDRASSAWPPSIIPADSAIALQQVMKPTEDRGAALSSQSFLGENNNLLGVASATWALEAGTGGESADVLLCAVVPHTTIPRRYRIDPITHTVQPDDNVSNIAERYGVSMETILWANGSLEDNPDYLADGDVLMVLPVSGVYHVVAKGDTLESIARQYQARVEDVTGYEGNYMQEPYAISVGQKLIVPGGRKPYQVRHVVAWSGEVPKGAKRGTGQFGWPMSGFVSQRYNEFHRAVDIAAPEGRPVKAADSGYVAVVGRNDKSYGRYVLIDHGNGFQSLYAHFSVVYVEVGQSVGKGQTIGLCGSTGKSTGPHVHLEIKLNGVQRNPLLYLK